MYYRLLHDRGLSRLVETLGDWDQRRICSGCIPSCAASSFVDPAVSDSAYTDVTLPLGYQQTLSQPSFVARMLELLRGGRPESVQVGAESGFQTGLLAPCRAVFAINEWRLWRQRPKADG